MTESDDTKYPIGRREVIPHPAILQSIEHYTGRYENARFHISRQAIPRSANEHDLIRPPTRVHHRTRVHPRNSVHPSDKCPLSTVCALRTRSLYRSSLSRPSIWDQRLYASTALCLMDRLANVFLIYIVCNSSHLVVEGQS
jgi:hypothetical protein